MKLTKKSEKLTNTVFVAIPNSGSLTKNFDANSATEASVVSVLLSDPTIAIDKNQSVSVNTATEVLLRNSLRVTSRSRYMVSRWRLKEWRVRLKC